jgi:DNA-binding transcriptional MerR regulator
MLREAGMTTKSIPELLKHSLQSHMAEADLRDDEELKDIITKLSTLSDKVAAAKAQALMMRARKAAKNI